MRRIWVLVAFALIGFSGCGTSIATLEQELGELPSDLAQPEGITVLGTGDLDGPTISFALDLSVGDSWTSTMTMIQTISFDIPGAPPATAIAQEITQTATVTSITDAGNFVFEVTIDNARILNADEVDPLAVPQLELLHDEMKKMITGSTVTPFGEALSSTSNVDDIISDPAIRNQLSQTLDQIATVTLAPAGTLGVGARWRVEIPLRLDGIDTITTSDYVVTEITGERYRLEFTVEQTMQGESLDGGQLVNVTGSSTGGGVIESTTNRLVPAHSETDITLRSEFSAEGETVTMTMDMSVELADS